MGDQSFFPLLKDLKSYRLSDFRSDLVAGLTVAVMLVPQGMAYALLAGVPPIYGLYGGLIPLFLYPIFGSCRQLSVGPVAISALLVLSGISQLAEVGSQEYIQLVILVGLMIGVLQLGLSMLRMGFLVNFLSHPVVAGFTSAAAVIIAASQLKDLLGIQIPRFTHLYETLGYAFTHLGETNWVTLTICLGAMAMMLGLKAVSRKLPAALIVVVLGTLINWYFNLSTQFGLGMVGGVPSGLPHFEIPQITSERLWILMPTAVTVTIIGIVESIGIAKVLESKHQTYTVRPNQELLAIGVSKIGGAFFQALPTSASFTRSAINDSSGAQTGMASILTASLIAVTLLLLTPLFYYLPNAILAAIILLAVRNLFDYKEAIHLWHTHRQDFIMMMVTFFITLLFGIEYGVFSGVILSVLAVLYRSTYPHFAVLGKLPDSGHYRNIERFEKAKEYPGLVIGRFDDQLYFGNASFFKDQVRATVVRRGASLKVFILDASNMHDIDSSGLHALEEIFHQLEGQHIQLNICCAIGPVRDSLFKSGLTKKLGANSQFLEIDDAIQFHLGEQKTTSSDWSDDALQTNIAQDDR